LLKLPCVQMAHARLQRSNCTCSRSISNPVRSCLRRCVISSRRRSAAIVASVLSCSFCSSVAFTCSSLCCKPESSFSSKVGAARFIPLRLCWHTPHFSSPGSHRCQSVLPSISRSVRTRQHCRPSIYSFIGSSTSRLGSLGAVPSFFRRARVMVASLFSRLVYPRR
jgi:hypothetical protein